MAWRNTRLWRRCCRNAEVRRDSRPLHSWSKRRSSSASDSGSVGEPFSGSAGGSDGAGGLARPLGVVDMVEILLSSGRAASVSLAAEESGTVFELAAGALEVGRG